MATTNANVTVDILAPEDYEAKYIPPQNPTEVYTDYTIYCKYYSEKHRYMMPVTSPGGFQGGRAAFVQLAAPTLLWIADWTAARSAVAPNIPDPTPRDPNWILLFDSYEPTSFVILDDGETPVYRISGIYIYGCKLPADQVIKNVNYPRPAWIDDVFNRSIPTSALEQGLINIVGGAAVDPGSIAIGG